MGNNPLRNCETRHSYPGKEVSGKVLLVDIDVVDNNVDLVGFLIVARVDDVAMTPLGIVEGVDGHLALV